MLSVNPSYQLAKEFGQYRFYTPVNIAEGYHLSRYVEALNQQIYANAGATRDVLQQTVAAILERCNDMKNPKTFRTDVAAIAQSIQYRLQYPVDQQCALRMGAILCFFEDENPDMYNAQLMEKKVTLALEHPELYTFFLTWGISNLPLYRERLDTLTDPDYFLKREEMIRSLKPLIK